MTESYFSVNEPATKRSLNIWFYFLTLFFSFNPLSEQEFDFTSKVDFLFRRFTRNFAGVLNFSTFPVLTDGHLTCGLQEALKPQEQNLANILLLGVFFLLFQKIRKN